MTDRPLCTDCGQRPQRANRIFLPVPLCQACDYRRVQEEMHLCVEFLATRSNLTWAWDGDGREVPAPCPPEL